VRQAALHSVDLRVVQPVVVEDDFPFRELAPKRAAACVVVRADDEIRELTSDHAPDLSIARSASAPSASCRLQRLLIQLRRHAH
jgi:hypothetical protein